MLFVFMSQPDFACNPHALWKYIEENTEHETGWLLKKDGHYEALKERGIRCALYDTLEGNRLLNEADYVITNSYTFEQLPKREHQIFVNLWHGSGVKAHDYFNHKLSGRQAEKLRIFFDKIDLMCVHSLDDRFRLSAMLHYDLRRSFVTGQARLDCVKHSDGRSRLVRLLGPEIAAFEHIIFFAPSFRANMSTHDGTLCSDNIFRLADYDDRVLSDFLREHHAALIYKLHPIEQTAFSGREFRMNPDCFEITDDMLFDADIRYGEILNAFDVMISDYSSIAYDFLLLDRPIVYLIPDYEEYRRSRGFVFHNVDYYMPGQKAFCFPEMLSALDAAFVSPNDYAPERQNVRMQRFDFADDCSAERCYRTIMEFEPPENGYTPYESPPSLKMPSSAMQLQPYVQNKNVVLIDSTQLIPCHEQQLEFCRNGRTGIYITGEIPSAYRRISGKNCYKIADLAFYHKVQNEPSISIAFVEGGVDYDKFSADPKCTKSSDKIRIGYAGTIDNRIYFAMVQYLCEAFPDCEIVFAGDIIGDFPGWLCGYDNLYYMEASYDELPDMIHTFDVAILPFFGVHKETVPTELFQYLACGKLVVASDMPNLPICDAIYISKSVSDSVVQIKRALEHRFDGAIVESGRQAAQKADWKRIAEKILSGMYCCKQSSKMGPIGGADIYLDLKGQAMGLSENLV